MIIGIYLLKTFVLSLKTEHNIEGVIDGYHRREVQISHKGEGGEIPPKGLVSNGCLTKVNLDITHLGVLGK